MTISDDGKHYTNVLEIGDNAFIGAGNKILGKIKIGSNVKNGANAMW